MNFLAFVTNNAERKKVVSILNAAKIEYEEEMRKSSDGKCRGCAFFVKESNFDEANELLSVPERDFAFQIIDTKREERTKKLAYEELISIRRKKKLRRMAINIAVLGLIFFIYALISRG